MSLPFRPRSWLLLLSLFWSLFGILSGRAEVPIPGYSLTLEWDANSEPDVAGYKVYFGSVSGTYTESFDAGSVTVATFAVPWGETYFFAVTAVNFEGLESEFSNEVTFTAPPFPELQVENIVPAAGFVAGDGMASISSPALLPDGSQSFTITAPAGHRLQVQASSDLVSWWCLGILENTTGEMIVTDTDAPRHRQRFYRIVEAAAD